MSQNAILILLGTAQAVASAFFSDRKADAIRWLTLLAGTVLNLLADTGHTITSEDVARWRADAQRREQILSE